MQAEYRRGQALGTIYIDRKEIRHGSIDSMSKEEVERKLAELRKIYQASPAILDVDDKTIEDAVVNERETDHSEELSDEERELVLSEDEEEPDESEDNKD